MPRTVVPVSDKVITAGLRRPSVSSLYVARGRPRS